MNEEIEVMDFDEFMKLVSPSKPSNDLNSVFSAYNPKTGRNEPPKEFSNNEEG